MGLLASMLQLFQLRPIAQHHDMAHGALQRIVTMLILRVQGVGSGLDCCNVSIIKIYQTVLKQGPMQPI